MPRSIAFIILMLSIVAYCVGITTPIVTIEKHVFLSHNVQQYTVTSSIETLNREGERGLAAIIALFTIVFPIAKYLVLFVGILTGPKAGGGHAIRFVEKIGKWSMLDVFVVALLVVMLKVNSFFGSGSARSEPAIFVYAFSVISAMVLAAQVGTLSSTAVEPLVMSSTQALRLCGFWPRVCATIIDALIGALLALPLMIYTYGAEYVTSNKMVHGTLDVVVNWVLPIFVTVAFWHRWGATPGKMMIGAKIVDANTGGPVHVGRLFGRYFGYFLSTIPLGMGLFAVGVDPKRQGWHDKVARTVVVFKE